MMVLNIPKLHFHTITEETVVSESTSDYGGSFKHVKTEIKLVECENSTNCDQSEWYNDKMWLHGKDPLEGVDLEAICNCCGEARKVHKGIDKIACRPCLGLFH